MLSTVKQGVVLEYTQRGIVSLRQIKEIQTSYGLSHTQTEELVSELIAHGVCILDDDKVERIHTVQTSIFYQDRRLCNSLLNKMPICKLIAVFLFLPDTEEIVDVSLFHRLPNRRQYLRELSRLRMVTRVKGKSEIRISEGFQHIQRAVHTYLDKGYIAGLQHSWRKAAKANIMRLAETVYQSPFFSSVVLPIVREYYLSLPEIKKFISWIAECSTQPVSMFDVVRYAIDCGELREVWWLLLGDVPSSSPTAIEDGSDVCFECLRIDECTPRFAGRYDQGAVRDLLREYRYEITTKILRKLASGQDSIKELIPQFAGDSMLVKFAINCHVVRASKQLLQDIGVVERSAPIVFKSRGLYCPQQDFWSF